MIDILCDADAPLTGSMETLGRYEGLFSNPRYGLEWDCLFVLPLWLTAWYEAFGKDRSVELIFGWHGSKLMGVAPLMREGNTLRFMGAEDVCDYQDMVLCPGPLGREFLQWLLPHLKERGIHRLEFGALRPDSAVLSLLPDLAETNGYRVRRKQVGRSYELALPKSWDRYLDLLSGKQRHEVRRKLRRLNEAGRVEFRVVQRPEETKEAVDLFLTQFAVSRQDKSHFLTRQRKLFFQSLTEKAADRGLLRLGILTIDKTPAATVLCFDFHNTRFLYNNGYDPRFRSLSPGILSKVYSIKDAIENGRRCYNFLKGDEAYKKQLGGKAIALYKLLIELEK